MRVFPAPGVHPAAFAEHQVCQALCRGQSTAGTVGRNPEGQSSNQSLKAGCGLAITSVRVSQGRLLTRKKQSSKGFGALLSVFRPQCELKEKGQQRCLNPDSWGNLQCDGWGRRGQHGSWGGFPPRRAKGLVSMRGQASESPRAEQRQVPLCREDTACPESCLLAFVTQIPTGVTLSGPWGDPA